MAGSNNDGSRGRSSSPRPRQWSAADSDKCECVLEVMSDDVLLGRGSGPNDHVGNIKFRDLVHERKAEYLSTNHRQTKAMIAKDIVDQVYQRGGRFLKKLSPVESAKILPKLLAKNKDDSENDRTDTENPGPCDVYQIQKHATVMEKAKQALRQNQRNGSPEMPENRSMSPSKTTESARRDSMGRANKISPDTPPHGILNNNNNNWNGMNMGSIPTTLNNTNNVQRHHGGQFQQNNLRDTFDMPNNNYSNSPQGRNQQDSYQQQLFQQQQDLLNLQEQHKMLQMQYQQRQQQNQQQQHLQNQQLELETHNQLLQEQLELQIRQEQLRHLQQQSLEKIKNNAALYKQQQHQEPLHTGSQSSPPAVLNGYATYTTTLDAIEGNRHTSNDGLADPHEINYKDDGKMPDDKSMQMSTMMGSFKDMSVKSGEDHDMHNSSASIGTIDNIPAGLSMVHMSGVSMMSMMNDSTDSLFKNNQKPNDMGGKNASWGNANNMPTSTQAPLADVIESHNPAAVAAAAVLGKSIPGFDKAQRRWSGGYIPAEVNQVPIQQRRVNRRGSLQFTSNNASNDINQMQATASAMLAMAQAEHEKQEQTFNYLNNSNGHNMNFGNDMMNNQGYHMDNGGYGMNSGYHNN